MTPKEHRMSPVQRLITAVFFPFRASIEAHSRSWNFTCPCGHSRSAWELGGIRWHANKVKHYQIWCPACDYHTMHKLHRL